MGLLMTAVAIDQSTRLRVWLLGGGRHIASRPGGWPKPDGYPDWSAHWSLPPDTWICHEPGWWHCREVAIWRVSDGRTRGYYCGRHLPIRPIGDPAELCGLCGGPMDS